ncbi:MAG: hypothetical protein ACRBBW_01105 [Cellvibrionaceae bacterium]
MMALRSINLSFWVACWLALFSCAAHAEAPVTGSKPFKVLCAIPENHESYRPIRYVYRQALEQLGYELEWQVVSPARAFHNITHDNGDAVCLTTPLTLKLLDTGVGDMLNTVVGSSAIYGWSIRDDIIINRQLLQPNTQLRIGYLKNFTGDFFLKSLGITQGIAIKDVSMAAKMMISGRLDAMILIETESFEKTLSYWLERQQIDSSKQLHHNIVSDIHYVPYLHQRHEHLRPALEQALQKLIEPQGGPISRKTIAQWLEVSSSN